MRAQEHRAREHQTAHAFAHERLLGAGLGCSVERARPKLCHAEPLRQKTSYRQGQPARRATAFAAWTRRRATAHKSSRQASKTDAKVACVACCRSWMRSTCS